MMVAKAARTGWKELHRIADAEYPGLVAAMEQAIQASKASVTLTALREALASDPQAALTLLATAWQEEGLPGLRQAMREAMERIIPASAEVAQLQLQTELPGQEVLIESVFSRVNAAAATFAEAQSGRAIREISDTTLEAVRGVLQRAFRDGQSPDATARALRDILGLTDRQARALERYRDGLQAVGVTGDSLARLVRQRIAHMIAQRAEVVMRTETMRSSMQGQNALWETANRAGIMPQTFKRYWLVTPDDRLCPICAAIPGRNVQGRSMGEPFQSAVGVVMFPPAHPQCRCALTGRMQ